MTTHSKHQFLIFYTHSLTVDKFHEIIAVLKDEYSELKVDVFAPPNFGGAVSESKIVYEIFSAQECLNRQKGKDIKELHKMIPFEKYDGLILPIKLKRRLDKIQKNSNNTTVYSLFTYIRLIESVSTQGFFISPEWQIRPITKALIYKTKWFRWGDYYFRAVKSIFINLLLLPINIVFYIFYKFIGLKVHFIRWWKNCQ